MSRIENVLRAIAITISTMALFCISPTIAAYENAKRAPWVGTIVNGPKCDGGNVPFGPYDYVQRKMFPGELQVVEDYHFRVEAEELNQRGSPTTPLDDIHYTLQTWPNHHNALNLAVRHRLHHAGQWIVSTEDARWNVYRSGYPAECYLQRAINFSPNDPVPYIMYGMILHKLKQYEGALKAYRRAIHLLPNDIVTQYNMALTLVASKHYEEAEQIAKKVYGSGFPLPGLKNKLIATGHWNAEKKKEGPAVAQPELTESQVAAIKKAMLEGAMKKTIPKEAAPVELAPVDDEGVDPAVVRQ